MEHLIGLFLTGLSGLSARCGGRDLAMRRAVIDAVQVWTPALQLKIEGCLFVLHQIPTARLDLGLKEKNNYQNSRGEAKPKVACIWT
jgi:hypothetical protein